MRVKSAFFTSFAAWAGLAVASNQKPNIIFIFTDDQDYLHGSLDTQKAVQKHLVGKGTLLTKHFATVSVCCPSRVSLMRGQAAHNTNNTDISAPGGGYPKFAASGEDDNYLPHWLAEAGYKTEYIGKLFNGNSLLNYSPAPKGWSHIDVLLDPYINVHNSVVMSENGERPKWYRNFQQTDVIRIKALARLESLLNESDPFFLMISPTAPHVENLTDPPTPPARYVGSFPNVTVSREVNFNPPSKFQDKKPSWLRNLPSLNQTQINEIDHLFRRRLESLQGVDDIVEDVVTMLEKYKMIDNTYIIYSTDQGYHLGTHRHVGKTLPYVEDTNIPLVVRGPGVPEGVISRIPSTVTDFAPTFLEIAGLSKNKHPSFLDGSSMLPTWKNPQSEELAKEKGIINVEYWGSAFTELPSWSDGDYPTFPGLYLKNDYKTMRIVDQESAWMYSRWCTNDTELYNTIDDPHELNNLANSTDPYIERDTCRDPWSVLQPKSQQEGNQIRNLEEALNSRYDEYFNSFPQVSIEECVGYQLAPNEFPFYPLNAEKGLGLEHRKSTDNFEYPTPSPKSKIPGNSVLGGGWDHRHATLQKLLDEARELTDDEIQQSE